MSRIYKVFAILLLVMFWSCIDCEQSAQAYRKYDLEVVLIEKPTIISDMEFVGTKINSSEIITTRIMGRWFRNYIDYMEVGDTVIKRKGELVLYIHKRDTVMSFSWDCQGKVYE